MSHYRVTLPAHYGPNTPGNSKPSARQGYYADAETPEQAARVVEDRLCKSDFYGSGPSDTVFDVQPWEPVRGPAVRVTL